MPLSQVDENMTRAHAMDATRRFLRNLKEVVERVAPGLLGFYVIVMGF